MSLPTEDKNGGTDISVVLADAPKHVVITSLPYVKTEGCKLCRDLPEDRLLDLTLDVLGGNKTLRSVMDHYTQFLKPGRSQISPENVKRHMRHASKSMLADTDRKALTIHSEKMELLQELLRKESGMSDLSDANVRILEDTLKSFVTYGSILRRQEAELAELESGKLPDVMKDTYQITPQGGKTVTAPLYPLIERKRREVLGTQARYLDARMRLQAAMLQTTRAAGDSSMAIAVDQIFRGLNAIQKALSDYLGFGARVIREVVPGNDLVVSRYGRATVDFLQKKVFTEVYKIEGILRNLLEEKK